MRKTIILLLAAVLIIVVIGGYFAFTYYSNQNQNNTPASTAVSIEQIRDQAMTYIAANFTQTLPLMPTTHWSGGRQDTGGLGAETYQYAAGDWAMMLQYPVVPNPVYTITANYSAGDGLTWMGTYQNGVIAQTSSSIPAQTNLTQEQIRDLMLQYLMAYHNQTTQYMHDLSWSGGRMDMGMMVGSDAYSYQASGWNVTMQYPVVPNPVYTITAQYAPMGMQQGNAMMSWQGTLQNGVIIENQYKYNP